jgi:hypothetical protein
MPVIETETTTNRIRTESADFQSSLSVQLELGVPSARSSLAAGVLHSRPCPTTARLSFRSVARHSLPLSELAARDAGAQAGLEHCW